MVCGVTPYTIHHTPCNLKQHNPHQVVARILDSGMDGTILDRAQIEATTRYLTIRSHTQTCSA